MKPRLCACEASSLPPEPYLSHPKNTREALFTIKHIEKGFFLCKKLTFISKSWFATQFYQVPPLRRENLYCNQKGPPLFLLKTTIKTEYPRPWGNRRKKKEQTSFAIWERAASQDSLRGQQPRYPSSLHKIAQHLHITFASACVL